MEHEVVEVGVAGDEHPAHGSGLAVGFEAGKQVAEALFIAADDVAGDGDLRGAAGLDVGQSHVADKPAFDFECGFEFAACEDLQAGDVEAASGVGKVVEGAGPAGGVEEVAHEDEDAAPTLAGGDASDGRCEVGLPRGGGGQGQAFEEEIGEALQALASAHGPELLDATGVVEACGGEAVLVDQGDVSQGHGQAIGKDEFGRRTDVHGRRTVEDEDDGEVFLFAEEFDEESVESCVDVPIDVSEVVAGDVGAEVFELDALPALLGTALAREFAGENLAADHVETIETAHDLRGKEFIERLGPWRPLSDDHVEVVQ